MKVQFPICAIETGTFRQNDIENVVKWISIEAKLKNEMLLPKFYKVILTQTEESYSLEQFSTQSMSHFENSFLHVNNFLKGLEDPRERTQKLFKK